MAGKNDKGASATQPPEVAAPQSDADHALALLAENEALKAQLAEANARAESAMRKVAEQEQRLSPTASPSGASVLTGARRARHCITCAGPGDTTLRLKPGDAIPADADLEGVGPESIEEG